MTPTKGLKIRLKRKGDAISVSNVGRVSAEGDDITVDVPTAAEDMKTALTGEAPSSMSISPVSSSQNLKEQQGGTDETLAKNLSIPEVAAPEGAHLSLPMQKNDQKTLADKSRDGIEGTPPKCDSGLNELPHSQVIADIDPPNAEINGNGELLDQDIQKHPDLEQARTVEEASPACSSGLNADVSSLKAPEQQEPLTQELYRIPGYAGWFSWSKIHTIERRTLSEFFEGKSPSKAPKIYKDYRDFIINKYRENPQKPLTFTKVRKMLVGDVNCIKRVFEFLEEWGLINYHVAAGEKPTASTISSFPMSEPLSSGLELVFPPLTSESTLLSINRTYPPVESRGLQLATLASHENVFSHSTKDESIQGVQQSKGLHIQDLNTDTNADDLEDSDRKEKDAFKESGPPIPAQPGEHEIVWSQEETILLLEGISKYRENWSRVAEHVGTKSKNQCIMQFIQLPYGDSILNDLDSGMPKLLSTSTKDRVQAPKESMVVPNLLPPLKKQKVEQVSEKNSIIDEEINATTEIPSSCTLAETKILGQGYASPCIDLSNPLISQVAFMSAIVGPRVAAAAAHAALTTLAEEDPGLSLSSLPVPATPTHLKKDILLAHLDSSKDASKLHANDGDGEGDGDNDFKPDNGPGKEPFKELLPSAVQVRTSFATALAAAAANAKLLADQEEREMEHLVVNIIETQLKKLHSKLEHFEELEFLLEKERMQLEQTRAQVFADRLKLAQQQFPAGILFSQHRHADFSRRI